MTSYMLTVSLNKLQMNINNLILGFTSSQRHWAGYKLQTIASYFRTTITVMDIIHRPILYLKHDVSETGLCLGLQVGRTHVAK
jgi:hypothetical protein